jgi:Glycosyl transferase family 2/Galactosyltransferase
VTEERDGIMQSVPEAQGQGGAMDDQQDIVGHVESIHPGAITGWAFSRSGQPLQLTCRISGQAYEAEPAWGERSDVSAEFGAAALMSGFQIRPQAALQEALSREGLCAADVVLLANGQALMVDEQELRQQGMADELHEKGGALQGHIESFQDFMIRGWVVARGGGRTTLEVRVNGLPLLCDVIRSERKDVEEALGVNDPEAGFEIVLPGYLWEQVHPAGTCEIRVTANGGELTPAPIVLSRERAVQWIGRISQLEAREERQFFGLLALEHVRYGRLLPQLDDDAGRFVRDLARDMGLEAFLFDGESSQAEEASAPSEDVSTLLLWKALRRLNERIVNAPAESVFAQVKAVHDELHLAGEPRRRYLLSVIPLLCRRGDFLHLRQLADLGDIGRIGDSSDVWLESLAVAAVAADGDCARTADLLWRLSKHPGAGWLNTECVRFAVDHVQELDARGTFDPMAAEKVRYSFVGLLSALQGDWFSRLHDQELIDAMIGVLAGLDRYSDYHKSDIAAAAVRLYGLCPSFWERLDARVTTLRDPELARARAAWSSLHRAFSEGIRALPEHLDGLRRTLAYFHRRGNREALVFLREVIARALSELNRSLSPSGSELIEALLASDPSEALRIAAFPLAGENALQARYAETSGLLLSIVRQISERDRSVVYDLQCSASAALREVQAAAFADDRSALQTAGGALEASAATLANARDLFLGADLLASAYGVTAASGLDAHGFLMRLDDVVRRAVRQTKAGSKLPAPVCAAISCLAGMQSDTIARGILRELQAAVNGAFGPRYDGLFSPSSATVQSLAANGWPRDTLVIIYSCRKYLDTRVQAIRETWVQDLKSRGIPYVVLVGDGNDAIEGDVLALDVSDRYEDLPQKTLKLFDWVYRHTDAQYVLKIDDDCYLDVDRFFDTLSYRKHHYYGRVIRRNVGSMDRTWHQKKSHTLLGRKAIDRSPEPSLYADGGGGYCLSRLAVRELLSAAMTNAGRRLKAASFMEDKLVGDLLAVAGIQPSNEDYESYQRRRTFGTAMPVGMWENSFFPSKAAPTKVVHLDTERDMMAISGRAKTGALWPKKLWPTASTPSIVFNSIQIELLTPVEAATALLRHDVAVVSVVRNEIVMMPHFLAHYRALGVKSFIMVDNCSDDGSREYLFQQPDVVLYSADAEYKYSHYGVAWQQAVLGNLCLGKWVLLADADELLVYPGCEQRSLSAFIAEVASQGADAVRIDMVDMYPFGDLQDANLEKQEPFAAAPWFDSPAIEPWHMGKGWFSNVHGFVSHLRHRAVPDAPPHDFVAQKYALLRYQPWVRLSQGLHYAANVNVSEGSCWFAHFKYHAGFKEKVETEIRRGQHFNNAAEYRRYATMLAEGHGGFGRGDISMKYEGSGSFSGRALYSGGTR